MVVVEILNLEKEKQIQAISKIGKRTKFDISTFLENINQEKLIGWINEIEIHFEYEDIEDLDRIKFRKAKLKGHTRI